MMPMLPAHVQRTSGWLGSAMAVRHSLNSAAPAIRLKSWKCLESADPGQGVPLLALLIQPVKPVTTKPTLRLLFRLKALTLPVFSETKCGGLK
jgi:hypothetical protein